MQEDAAKVANSSKMELAAVRQQKPTGEDRMLH